MRHRTRRLLRTIRKRAHLRLAQVLPSRLLAHLPAVKIDTGAAVPGWALRLAVAGLALGTAALVAEGTPSWLIIGFLVAGIVLAPGGILPASLVIAIGSFVTLYNGQLGAAQTAGLVAGGHVVAQLSALAGQASWLSRIELRTLLLPARRVVAIQAVCQPLALVAGWLADLELTVISLPVLATFGITGLVIWWVPSLRRS